MDSKSASFCGAKWYNATVWLGSGMTTSCHQSLAHKIDAEAIQTNQIITQYAQRKKNNVDKCSAVKDPEGCNYCWKIEDMGPEHLSDRVYKSWIYTNEELTDAYTKNYRRF